jgi:hypothetical protein
VVQPKKIAVEFIHETNAETPDLLLNSDTHTEVKTLVDTSKWSLLIRKIRSIKSDYNVIIGTDYELTGPQVHQIVSNVRNTVGSLTMGLEHHNFPAAQLTFIQAPGQGTHVISIGPRTLDENPTLLGPMPAMDLRGTGEYALQLKAAAVSRLAKASRQLAGYSKTVAVLDLERHFSSDEDFLDEIFLGSLQGDWSNRAPDGIVSEWRAFPNVQTIVVFANLQVRKVLPKPQTRADSWLG